MNRSVQIITAVALCAGLLATGTLAFGAVATKSAQSSTSARTKSTTGHNAGLEAAKTISTVTGVAISPLLGVGGIGAYKWWNTPEEKRSKLPWFAQPWFWVPALLIVGIVGLKDIVGTAAPSALKKPFDVAEAVENKISALVAAGAFLPLIISIFPGATGDETSLTGDVFFAAINGSVVGNAMLLPFALAAFAVVWLASHAINVLIILSPFTLVDTGLKMARFALLGLFTAVAMASPYIGAAVSISLILFCYFVAGWSFRLMVFGTVYAWDYVTLRSTRFQPGAEHNVAFAARAFPGVPVRSLGRLVRSAGGLAFVHRPWLLMPVREYKPAQQEWMVGRGLFCPEIAAIDSPGQDPKTMFVLPPRYQSHEVAVARVYGITDVRDVGLLKNVKSAWSWLKGNSGYSARLPASPQEALASS